MKSPHGQFIDNTCEDKLKKLGFEKITQLGWPHHKLSCGWRCKKSGSIHLFPIFEASGNNNLYFDYSGGRLEISSVDQLKKLISALKH